MTTSVTSTSVGQLDPYFTNLINNLMAIERQPLTRLQQARDTANVQLGVYTDLNAKLKDLQSSITALRSSTALSTTSLTVGRSATVSATTSGTTVLTASATSTASTGLYQLSVTSLSREHRVWSDAKSSVSQDLGLTGSFQLNGQSFDMSGQSLNSLVADINGRTYATNQGVTASIVDNRLVLSAQTGGTANALQLTDGTGSPLQSLGIFSGGSINALHEQTATDAVFTMNGVTVTRSQNTSLTDVVEGLTLNLANDAPGKAATLTIAQDATSATAAISTMLTKFNSVQTYLQAKTAVTAATNTDGKPTYTRGVLADDTVFGNLRERLFTNFGASVVNSGSYTSLRDIGISLDSNLQASVTDSSKLQTALTSKLSDVQALFEAVGSKLNTLLGDFTGVTTGYLDSAITRMSAQISQDNTDITNFNQRLTDKRQALVDQYSGIQGLLTQMAYDKQTWQSIASFSTSG